MTERLAAWVTARIRSSLEGVLRLLVAAVIGAIAICVVLTARGSWVVVVASGSMRPAYEVGDAVVVQAATTDDVRVGDAIVFSDAASTRMIIHRVVDIVSVSGVDRFRTKGDANNSADAELVNPKNVRARAVYSVPHAGWVYSALTGKFGIVVLLGALSATWTRRALIVIRARRGRNGSTTRFPRQDTQ